MIQLWPYLSIALWFLMAVLTVVLQRFLASPAWTLMSFAALLTSIRQALMFIPTPQTAEIQGFGMLYHLRSIMGIFAALCFCLAFVLLLANYHVIRHYLAKQSKLEGL